MATEVRLPQWSMGMSDGKVVSWHCRVGDRVEEDTPLAEIEAEKTSQDLLAPVAGVILKILVTEATGAVPVRTVLAIIGEPDEATTSTESAALPGTGSSMEPIAAPVPTPAGTPSPTAHRQVAPIARRLASDLGIELESVEGTGPGGRVTPDDVRRAATPSPGAVPPTDPTVDDSHTPLKGMRAAIASKMHASLQEMAQLTLSRQIDVTELIETQRALKHDTGLSFTDLLLRAVALALTEHPNLNATLVDSVLTVHPHVNLGLAVALDDGLIVPVIQAAQSKSVGDIAREAKALAAKVRAGVAGPADVSGGTFTVTNLGALEIDSFTPIVNPPEVAILGVGRVSEVLTRTGEGMRWRSMLTVSLTIDHRAVDGAPGARFLQTLASLLGDPAVLTADPASRGTTQTKSI